MGKTACTFFDNNLTSTEKAKWIAAIAIKHWHE